jgi:hypothetical protein
MTRKTIIALVASASIAAASLAPAVSQAQPISTGAKASCSYKGATTSDGGVVLQDDGIYYKCVNGSWVYDHTKPTLVLAPPKTTTPTAPTHVVARQLAAGTLVAH